MERGKRKSRERGERRKREEKERGERRKREEKEERERRKKKGREERKRRERRRTKEVFSCTLDLKMDGFCMTPTPEFDKNSETATRGSVSSTSTTYMSEAIIVEDFSSTDAENDSDLYSPGKKRIHDIAYCHGGDGNFWWFLGQSIMPKCPSWLG